MWFSKSHVRKRGILLLCAVLLSFGLPNHAAAQNAETFSSIDLALGAIRQTFNVSTGFEIAVDHPDKTPVTLDLSEGTVTNAFDDLIAQRPNYVWSLRDGFYDVYPKTKAESFSQLTVSNYVVKDANLKDAVDAISNLPEIQQWLTQQHMRGVNLMNTSGVGPPPSQTTRSLSLQNVQVRTILNQVFRSFGETQWTILHQGEDIGMSFSH